jgi:hypothetical protein
MEERRNLHGIVQMHRITKHLAPDYLTERITQHQNIHSYNTRNRKNIVCDKLNTSSRAHSFFPKFSKLYNDVNKTIDYRNTSVETFKKHAKSYVIKNRI